MASGSRKRGSQSVSTATTSKRAALDYLAQLSDIQLFDRGVNLSDFIQNSFKQHKALQRAIQALQRLEAKYLKEHAKLENYYRQTKQFQANKKGLSYDNLKELHDNLLKNDYQGRKHQAVDDLVADLVKIGVKTPILRKNSAEKLSSELTSTQVYVRGDGLSSIANDFAKLLRDYSGLVVPGMVVEVSLKDDIGNGDIQVMEVQSQAITEDLPATAEHGEGTMENEEMTEESDSPMQDLAPTLTATLPLTNIDDLPPPFLPHSEQIKVQNIQLMQANKESFAEQCKFNLQGGKITQITVCNSGSGSVETAYARLLNDEEVQKRATYGLLQRLNSTNLSTQEKTALMSSIKTSSGEKLLKDLVKVEKGNKDWLKTMLIEYGDDDDGVRTKLKEWLEAHLDNGPFADAAMECYQQNGRLILRLFIDGRIQCDGNVILCTVKIEGHNGNGAQPEVTVALVVAEENKQNLKKFIRPVLVDYFLLESQSLKIYNVEVPIFCTVISDGKMLQLLIGSEAYNSKSNGACTCPLCMVKKAYYTSVGQPRTNDPVNNVMPFKFLISERVFFDPLHCGLRLGESILNAVAGLVNINTIAGRTNWVNYCSQAGVKCVPLEATRQRDAVQSKFVLPSLPLTKLFCLLSKFPFEQAIPDQTKAVQYRSLVFLFLEVFECIRNRDQNPALADLCLTTAHMFCSLLGDKCRQWYLHVLAVHIPATLVKVDAWSLSCSTGEARQKAQRLIRLRRVWNGLGDNKAMQTFLVENQSFAATKRYVPVQPFRSPKIQQRCAQLTLDKNTYDVMSALCRASLSASVDKLKQFVLTAESPKPSKHYYGN